MKILQYLKEKELREEEQAKEIERQKAEKEREVARLRAQQEKAKDKQAERVIIIINLIYSCIFIKNRMH